MRREVDFYAQGTKLAGIVHAPNGEESNRSKSPAVVFCHGYTGSKEGQVARHAAPLLEAGYVCLTFDHRGFGESEGPRGRLIPGERVEDVKSAVTFLREQPEVDRERIGLFGLSVGASIVLSAAVETPIKCVVSVSPFGDGERWLRSLRRYWEWQEFLKAVEEDRVTRVLAGTSRRIDALEIMVPPPELDSHYVERRERGNLDEWSRPLESADSIIGFRPEAIVDSISPKALLIIHGGDDDLVPVSESRSVYERANEPKRLAVIPGATHIALYRSFFEKSIGVARNFLDEYLKQN